MGLDEELALRLQQGDESALEILIRRYHVPIHAYVARMVGEYHLASDIVQEVFIKLCRHISQYRPGLPFRPWIYTIASNTYKDYLKKAYVQRDILGLDTGDYLAVAVDTPEMAFLENAKREQIRDALQRLGEIYREVLILRYYQELKLEEIAQMLQIPLGTVKSRLATALRELHRILGSGGDWDD